MFAHGKIVVSAVKNRSGPLALSGRSFRVESNDLAVVNGVSRDSDIGEGLDEGWADGRTPAMDV